MNKASVNVIPYNEEQQRKLLEEALEAAGAEIKRLAAENTRLRAEVALLRRYH